MLAFVTVVFEPELGLLALQARSLARFADPDLIRRVSQIVVIDNTATGMGARAQRRLRSAYGSLGERVRIWRPSQILGAPAPAADGWTVQQILKLAVADQVEAAWYVVLDAKNIAVAPLRHDTFFAPDGRAAMGRHSYGAHPLRERVTRTLDAVGVSHDVLDDFPLTHTPVVLNTEAVHAATAGLARRAGTTFAGAFVAAGLLEFPFYAATLIREGRLDSLHSRAVVQTPALWKREATRAGVAAFATRVAAPDARFIALHRAAVVRLGPRAGADLARLLSARGLFDSPWAARRFLVGFTLAFARAKAGARVRAALGAALGAGLGAGRRAG